VRAARGDGWELGVLCAKTADVQANSPAAARIKLMR
jgi:hypothetical protein